MDDGPLTGSGPGGILGIALAYLGLGAAGLMLAIPPGYASPVFPAAGLALVAALRFGAPALPGILLGSITLNLGHAAVRGNLTTATALVAVVIGVGATAQALAGRWLVLRAGGPAWQRMEREQDALRFLLLGGVLAGAVAASVAVPALRVAGVITRAEIPFTWWNWYVGDVVGVLVFAPLILCLLGGPDPLWRERRRTIVLPMLLTFALAILAFYGGARWERQAEDAKLQADGEILSERIADRVVVHREMLASLRNFLLAQPAMTFEQFEEFTRLNLQENPDVFAMSVNDVVPEERRPLVEAALRGIPRLGPFQITERDGQRQLVRAGSRPEYVTVRYIVPLEGNRAAVGFDILSEPVRRAAIERARATGRMALTAPVRLVQERTERVGMLELLPVAGIVPPGGGTPALALAVAVLKLDEMIELATRGYVPAGLVFEITDAEAPPTSSLLYRSPGWSELSADGSREAARWNATIQAGQRRWLLTVAITGSHLQQHRPWVAWAVGVAGLLFATLLQVLMLGMTGRTAETERRAEELRASETRYRDLLENLQAGVVVHAADTSIVIANATACRLLGFPLEQLRGKTAADPGWRFVREDGSEVPPSDFPVQRVLSTGASVTSRLAGIVRPGQPEPTWVLVHAYPVPGPGGGVAQVVSTFIDITERRRAEAAVEERERELETILRTALDGFWVTDREGRLVDVNQAACDMLGYTRDELLRMRVGDLEVESAEPGAPQHPGPHRASGVGRFEARHRRKDGRVIDVEISAQFLPVRGGRFVTFIRDVTARRVAEEQLRQSQKMEAVGQLAGGIAHDFNNLLTVMLSASGFAMESAPPDGQLREDIAEFQGAAEKARALTKQLLAFSRRQVLEPRLLDLGTLVRDTERILRRLIGEHITLRTDLAPGLGAVLADPGQIQQAILNLAINARDAMPRGGRLTIETANIDGPITAEDPPEGSPAGPWVRLSVEDDGVGMDERTRARIFEPFFTTKPVGKGTGLGLPTVFGIVRQSGGTIRVDSEPGRGSRFELYFPRVASDRPVSPTPQPTNGVARRPAGETVLVVEDDDQVRRVAVRILRAAGYDVLSASTLAQAVEISSAHPTPPAVLLTDVRMPSHSGPQASAALTALWPRMRTVYMSGYASEVISDEGGLGPDVLFVPKPFTAEVLLGKIREALQG